MDFRNILNPLLKWWWLLILSAVLSVATCWYFLNQQPALYRAHTTLVVGQSITDPNPSGNELYLSQQLSDLYAAMANREPIRKATRLALGINILPNYEVTTSGSGQFIEIDVFDTNPELAMITAAELANQLILASPSNLSPEETQRQAFIAKQITDLETGITETELQLSKKNEEYGSLTSAREINRIEQEIHTLEEKLSTLRNTYAGLVSSSESSATNVLSIVEPASLPVSPEGINPFLVLAIAGIFGLVLAGAGAFLLEYLDDRIQSPEDVARTIKFPILGYIAEMEQDLKESVYVIDQPTSMIAEGFRTLRANLEFPSTKHPVKTLVITSPDSGDGKSTTAVNLALVYAQSGKKVVFVDADLRKPNSHNILGIENTIGLSEVMQNKAKVSEALQPYMGGLMRVITAGNMTSVPSEMLNSSKIVETLNQIGSSAEMVIIDSAPMFVSDSILWAIRADAVLLVIKPGKTRKETTRIQVEQLQRLGATIIGVVLNRIPTQRIGSKSRYRMYYPYYYSKYGHTNGKKTSSKSFWEETSHELLDEQ